MWMVLLARAGIATRLFGSTSHNILGVTLVKADGSVVRG
jgi:FAD/FMN-containing dehydrogenase